MLLVNDNFKQLFKNQKPAVLLVTSNRCFFCDRMKKYLPEIEKEYLGIEFFELREDMEKDEHPYVAKLDINCFPTVFFIDKSKGKDVECWRTFRLEGEVKKDVFLQKIKICFKNFFGTKP